MLLERFNIIYGKLLFMEAEGRSVQCPLEGEYLSR